MGVPLQHARTEDVLVHWLFFMSVFLVASVLYLLLGSFPVPTL